MTRKNKHDTCYVFKALAAALSLLLLASVMSFIFLAFRPDVSSGSDSKIIFLRPDVCSSECIEIQKLLGEHSDSIGFDFSSMGYSQSSIAGHIIIYNGSALISGYAGFEQFKEQVCGFTKDLAACRSK